MPRTMDLKVNADVSGFAVAMEELERSAGRVGDAMSAAFRKAVVEGESFGDVLRDLALRLSSIALDSALAPLERGVSDLFAGLAEGLANAVGPTPAAASAVAAGPVTVNVTTPDVEGFRRSRGQVAALVARSAMRGRRSL